MTVANALTYPQSSTSVLLSSLATLGFLRFDPTDRTYSPLRVMLLGSWLQDELFGQGQPRGRDGAAAQAHPADDHDRAAPGHPRAVHLQPERPRAEVSTTVGVLRPICRSAVGKMLLSQLSDAEVTRGAACKYRRAAENRVVVRELLDEIAQIRARGWAETVDYPLPNRATLAWPCRRCRISHGWR
jgi:DNA-binding IclR family transcriptional regulator